MANPDPADDGPDPARSPAPPENRLMTTTDVAAMIGGNVTPGTVVRRYKKWGLPAHKLGRELRFWASDVYEWIRNHPA